MENNLIHETSPYLLQHAHNPVEWFPWKPMAFEKAKAENKPIIVSIGYSACHWCHVMEHESFESVEVAEVMNLYFVSIKVDREERPDVDQIYMEAIQAMGYQGGWPLNVFLTPEGHPFYGGTYFPKENWVNLLLQVHKAYAEHEDEIKEQALGLTRSINRSEMERFGISAPSSEFTIASAKAFLPSLEAKFDQTLGGLNKAPKFPMPCIYKFLLRSQWALGEKEAHRHTVFTLKKMARGGIYDQVGGGFARYSVDSKWLVPHFEKMLYDNAQLISLYAEAFSLTSDHEFAGVVTQTLSFLEEEMTSAEGGFYSALDADSEGVEGKFYVWKEEEISALLGTEDAFLCKQYYQVTKEGNWEHGLNILHRKADDNLLAAQWGISLSELQTKVANWNGLLKQERAKRVRPGLDDKIIASWNGLMLKGLADAYRYLGLEHAYHLANDLARFLRSKMMHQNCRLWHSYKNGKASHTGFLEDYAAVIQGFLGWYQASFQLEYLRLAQQMTDFVMDHFLDEAEGFFWFTDREGEQLIARKKEMFDNVISSSNSIMAENLIALYAFTGNSTYQLLAKEMVGKLVPLMEKEIHYLSNWGCSYLQLAKGSKELVAVGEQAEASLRALQQDFQPFTVFAASPTPEDYGVLKGRHKTGDKTTFFVCEEGACQLPVFTAEEARALLKS